MSSHFYHLVIESTDPHRLADFWAAALGQQILYSDDHEVIVGASADSYPGLCFLPVPEGKQAKNRLHIDLNPDDRDAEVARLIALGATRVDVGQAPEATWVVLADPEGNEFCVLRPHESLVS
jgi:predicted enzyme related to lactoylglutathione lyase